MRLPFTLKISRKKHVISWETRTARTTMKVNVHVVSHDNSDISCTPIAQIDVCFAQPT